MAHGVVLDQRDDHPTDSVRHDHWQHLGSKFGTLAEVWKGWFSDLIASVFRGAMAIKVILAGTNMCNILAKVETPKSHPTKDHHRC